MDDETVLAVWEKGQIIPDYDPNVWRWDAFGNVMSFAEYGNRDSTHGWEVDHIRPLAAGGGNNLANLRPLNWRANVARG